MEYNNEIIEAINASKKYKNRSSFQKNDFHNFYILKKNNLLDSLIPSTLPRITKERSFQIAKQYNTYSDFRVNENKCYRKALHNGWIEEYTWLKKNLYDMETKVHIVYAYEVKSLNSVYVGRTMRQSVRKMQHKTDIKDTLYNFILINNLNDNDVEYKILIDKLNASDSQYYENFYINQYKNNGWSLINKAKAGSLGGTIVKWDYNTCYNEALKYDNETEFRKNCPTANAKAVKLGWKKDYYWMKRYDPHVYYSYEECYEKAKPFSSLSQFQHNYPSYYRYSKANNFLQTFTWLYIKAKYQNIIEYDLNGNFICKHKNNCFKNPKRQGVINACNGKLDYSYGRIWRYEVDVIMGDGTISQKIEPIKRETTPIVQYTKNGEFIQEYESIVDASKAIGCSSSSIFDALREKKTILCYGYAWRYKMDVLDGNGNIIQKIKIRKNNIMKRIAQYNRQGGLMNVYETLAEVYQKYKRHSVDWTLRNEWEKAKWHRDKLYFKYVWCYETDVLDENGNIKNKINVE